MVLRRRLRVAYLLGSLLLLAASLHPPTAYSAPGDPPSGSPAGAVYQLPLEQGRADAAPKGTGGTSAEGTATGGATGNGEAGSLYRSENNFGSSSRVPGVATGAASAGAGGLASGTGAGGADSPDNGTAGAGGAAIAGGAVAAQSDSGNTSVAAGVVLLAAIALAAIALALLSRRVRGRAGS